MTTFEALGLDKPLLDAITDWPRQAQEKLPLLAFL